MSEGYNGYENWQTWNVALWLNNDEGLYRAVQSARLYSPGDAERFVTELLPNGTPDMDGADEYEGVEWGEVLGAIEEEE